jgi:hypothetical protein
VCVFNYFVLRRYYVVHELRILARIKLSITYKTLCRGQELLSRAHEIVKWCALFPHLSFEVFTWKLFSRTHEIKFRQIE